MPTSLFLFLQSLLLVNGWSTAAPRPSVQNIQQRTCLSMGLFDDIARATMHLPVQQMIDQRVARVSHILMKPGGTMSITEAKAQFESWKEEIGGDEAKFAECARLNSEDEETKARGGEIGWVTRLKQLPPQLDEVVFVKDPVPGVYGPVGSKEGLHLVYLHYCGEPMGKAEALFTPP